MLTCQRVLVPTKVVSFAADYAYVPPNGTDFLSEATLSQWRSLLPVGAGWKWVGNDPFFTTSMTHQLHCIVSSEPAPVRRRGRRACC